jgi:hypothetical protein
VIGQTETVYTTLSILVEIQPNYRNLIQLSVSQSQKPVIRHYPIEFPFDLKFRTQQFPQPRCSLDLWIATL